MASREDKEVKIRWWYSAALPLGSMAPLGLALPAAGIASGNWAFLLFLFLTLEFLGGTFMAICRNDLIVRKTFLRVQVIAILCAVAAVTLSPIFWAGLVADIAWWFVRYEDVLLKYIRQKAEEDGR